MTRTRSRANTTDTRARQMDSTTTVKSAASSSTKLATSKRKSPGLTTKESATLRLLRERPLRKLDANEMRQVSENIPFSMPEELESLAWMRTTQSLCMNYSSGTKAYVKSARIGLDLQRLVSIISCQLAREGLTRGITSSSPTNPATTKREPSYERGSN